MESFGNEPTKESTQQALENSKKILETAERRLQEAEDTPISNMFSEGEKLSAIQNHQAVIENARKDIAKYEEDLAKLD